MTAPKPAFKLELKMIIDGFIVDENRIRLLILIDRLGSILAASKALGINYSTAWEWISKLERHIGKRVIEARRGGRGGARLTEYGRLIVEEYSREYRRVFGTELSIEPVKGIHKPPHKLIYAGSHDPLLERILGILREREIEIEVYWIGSMKGIASIILGESDIAGIHLYDPDTGEYNIPLIRKHAHACDIVLIKGYFREQGFITRDRIDYNDIINGLIDSRLRLVNRNIGSGSRVLLDSILRTEAKRRGISFDGLRRRVRGYGFEVNTHVDVAKKIALNEADVGVGIRAAAEMYGLNFTPITWERFDFITTTDSINKIPVKEFINLLRSGEVRRLVSGLHGYRIPQDAGEIVRLL